MSMQVAILVYPFIWAMLSCLLQLWILWHIYNGDKWNQENTCNSDQGPTIASDCGQNEIEISNIKISAIFICFLKLVLLQEIHVGSCSMDMYPNISVDFEQILSSSFGVFACIDFILLSFIDRSVHFNCFTFIVTFFISLLKYYAWCPSIYSLTSKSSLLLVIPITIQCSRVNWWFKRFSAFWSLDRNQSVGKTW